jgi:hypothetical protein
MLQRIASLDVPGRLSSYNDKYVIVYDFKDVGMLHLQLNFRIDQFLFY